MSPSSKQPLSSAQQEIMEIFWREGELSVTEVQKFLANNQRELARNTVQTLIVRMEEKGWLKHRAVGRTFFYTPAEPKSVSMGQELKEMLERSFHGSAEQLVNSLLESYTLKKGEANRIRKMIDDADRQRKKR